MDSYLLLEQRWAEYNELDPSGMVVCSSGTAALHLALECLNPKGYRVVIPDFTMIACARAATLADLTPIFIDCLPSLVADPNLSYRSLYRDYLAKTFMAVHVYGRLCEYKFKIQDYTIIEDLAEAHTIKPGNETHISCWSFYRNKIVAGEEGGAVWFCDKDLARQARLLRNLGFTDAHNFVHIPRGHNYRMSNIHADIILQSLNKIDENVIKRRILEQEYNKYCPKEWQMPPRQSPWVYDLRIPNLKVEIQDHIIQELNNQGIAARHAFKPLSGQPEYSKCWHHYEGKESQANIASREVFYLPLDPNRVNKDDCKRSFELIQQIIS